MDERARIIGIDLGTTNTCVASVRNRVAKAVPTDKGNLILPSVVSLNARGDVIVGGVAKDQLLTQPKNTIWGAKRLIGRKYHSRTVQELKAHYSYEICEGTNGDAAVRLGQRVLSLPQISSLVLGQVKVIAEQFLGGGIPQAVISVPAYYSDNQRRAVKEAGRLAGFDVKRILNEPTAAALAYGFGRGLNQKVLVYDLGGGTFDVSVLQISGNVFEVLATGGDTFLGGVDFDLRVVGYVLDAFRAQTGHDLSQNAIALQRIKNAAEAAKIDLTLIANALIELPFIDERKGRPLDLRVPLSREQLNALTGDLVDRTFEICDRVLAGKGIRRAEIDEVILVGGQSRMPLVQQQIQRHFGKPPRKGVHPDECVALGAAIFGDSLGDMDAVTLLDALAIPIGYALPTGRFRRVLDKNALSPVSRGFRVPPPASPDATHVEIDVFQGESDRVAENEYLGTVRVPASAVGNKIEFRLNEESLLDITAEVPGLGMRPLSLDATRVPLSLTRALEAERLTEAPVQTAAVAGTEEGGLFSSLKKILGRG